MRPYTPVHLDRVREPWRWQSFPELNGLGLRCMAQSRTGAIWFGTDDGVRRYDGLTWTAYTTDDGLLGAPVNVLCVTDQNEIYAGTDTGISVFRDGQWTPAFPLDGDLPWSVHSIIQLANGEIWAGTAWGALRLSRDGPILYTVEDMADILRLWRTPVRIVLVPDVAVPARPWGESTGVRVTAGMPPTTAVVWKVAPGSPAESAGLEPGDRITMANGRRWVTQEAIDGEQALLALAAPDSTGSITLELSRVPLEGSYRELPIYSIHQDRSGRLWFGISSKGPGLAQRQAASGEILRYDPALGLLGEHTAWRLYAQSDSLVLDFEPRITDTQDGAIWVIANSSRTGVNRFDGHQWSHFRLSDYDRAHFSGSYTWGDINTAILETRDAAVWIGGQGGRLHVLRDGIWSGYWYPDVPIPRVPLVSLVEASDGAVWVGGLGHKAARLDYSDAHWMSYAGLCFEAEGPNGARWFIAKNRRVVRELNGTWTSFGPEDGLMQIPRTLAISEEGVVWLAGNHHEKMGTTQFRDGTWSPLVIHGRFSHGFSSKGIFFTSDGDVWLCAGGAWDPRRGHLGGILRFDGERWTHYTSPEVPAFIYGIVQTPDGSVWAGGNSLVRYQEGSWQAIQGPKEIEREDTSWIRVMDVDREGSVWLGTFSYGVFRHSEQGWTRYTVRDGLTDNAVKAITQGNDGSIWVGTDRGVSRFDGRSWTTSALPAALAPIGPYGLRTTDDGALWINRNEVWETVRHLPNLDLPETEIAQSLARVSPLGNTTIAWRGAALWQNTSEAELQYSWRLDGSEWSVYAADTSQQLLALAPGNHIFEVKSRTRALVEDPTPASVAFSVIPPVWRQAWFVCMVLLFVAGILFQTARVVRHDRRLAESNEHLAVANKELSGLNKQLQRERVAERLRAAVLSMEQLEDFEKVLAVLTEDLTTVGFGFDTCEIDVLEERIDALSMEYFEAHGFRYKTYRLAPGGSVESESFALSAPFPTLVLQAIERFIAGRPWQALGEDTSITEVPVSSYGRLRLISPKGERRTEDETESLMEFCDAISLGYTRYLDILEIQEATERRDQAREQLLREQEEELQTAHDLQMGLMPTQSPRIAGLDVSGQCLPANHVGGDTFQYFAQHNKLSICLADVTGHAMEAAIPAVMFSGILDTQMETTKPLEGLFASLNRSLCRSLSLGHRTYVCFSVAEIEGRALRLASCGCPYPLHFHAGEVSELRVEGYPLGVRPDTVYTAIQADLEQGDYLVFVSDGIPEAVNGDQRMFGDGRVQATIHQGCTEGFSAEVLVDYLLTEVRSFCGQVAQEDDMTCVVLRVTG